MQKTILFFSVNRIFDEYVNARKSKHDKRTVLKSKHVIQHIYFYEMLSIERKL